MTNTPPRPLTVVKVGGSLFDHPALGPGLNEYLTPILREDRVWLLPGGGAVTGVVRHLDRIHRLGSEASHWVALQSMSVTALFLGALVPGAEGGGTRDELRGHAEGVLIVDGYEFALDDEGRSGSLPHSWDVTSDSLAARIAQVGDAARLVLLKSVDVPEGVAWPEAAARGWVDDHFPDAVGGLTIEVVNFRRWLEERFPRL